MIKNDLELFVEQFADKPVAWGVDDCTMTSLQWVEQQRGLKLDAIPYKSKSQAYRLIAKNGGLENIWTSTLSGVLNVNHGEPQFGDVGLVYMETAGVSGEGGVVGGIFAYEGAFLWRGDGGFICLTPRSKFIHAVWSVLE